MEQKLLKVFFSFPGEKQNKTVWCMAFDVKKLINSYLLHLHDRFCQN